MTAITLTALRDRGVSVEPHEAVAIVQQLIHGEPRAGRGTAAAPPGPLAPDNVILSPDGWVETACDATPAVSEVALVLQAACADASMPGGLRYTVARALLDVDAPPFDSLDEFSEALQFFGARRASSRRSRAGPAGRRGARSARRVGFD